MNVPTQLNDPPMPGDEKKARPTWWQSLQRIYQQVARVINGNIEFGNPTSGPANINGVWITTTTPVAANVDFTITHNLGRPAVGYILMQSINNAGDLYTSPTPNPNPNTQLILRDNFNGPTTIVIFVI